MHTQDIAANVPALTRDYIHLAIQEALTPAIEEIFTEISRAKAMASKPQNPQTIAAEVAQTVEASISHGISNIINQKTANLRAELDTILAQIQEETAKTEASADRLLTAVADLEAKVRKWLDRDRYALTRAQVLKAMREKNNG